MKEFRLLTADEIEVRVKKCTANGATALLYKTARVDMAILDETVGIMNWETDYKEIKGNLYCGIGIRDSEEKPFIWKWDCGIESREDTDGNQKKGEASDAFKRAGFRVGIGRELYTSPFIFLKIPVATDTKGGKTTYKPQNTFDSYSVSKIEYNEKRAIVGLEIIDNKGSVVYNMNGKVTIPIEQPKQIVEQPKMAEITTRPVRQNTSDQIEYAKKVEIKYGEFAGKKLGELSQEELQKLASGTNKFLSDMATKLLDNPAEKIAEVDDGELPW